MKGDGVGKTLQCSIETVSTLVHRLWTVKGGEFFIGSLDNILSEHSHDTLFMHSMNNHVV